MKSVACAFCEILAGRAHASLLIVESDVVAFMDLRQAVPGHVLIVPRRHVPTIEELQPAEAAALMPLAVRVAQAMRIEFDPAGISLWQSNGAAAHQEVPHVHLHVQPRRPDDGLLQVYPQGLPGNADTPQLDALASRLRAHL